MLMVSSFELLISKKNPLLDKSGRGQDQLLERVNRYTFRLQLVVAVHTLVRIVPVCKIPFYRLGVVAGNI